jgi:hypothetical protein
MPKVRVQKGGGGYKAAVLVRPEEAWQAERPSRRIKGARIAELWQQTMKAGFRSHTGAAMVRPHRRRTGYALPDIFDEVEEDLRAERARSFARRFAGLGALGVVVVLVGTGAYVWWSQQKSAQDAVVASRFIAAAALADKDFKPLSGLDRQAANQASSTFAEIAAHGPAGYAVLARLRLSALQWQLGQKAQAFASWQAVADDTAAPRLLRDLALVTSAQHQVDSADPVLLKQSMEALTSADNPWRPMAQQVIALLDVRQGKTREAGDILRRLSIDPSAPDGIRQMAGSLATALPTETPPAASPPVSPPAASPKPASHG